MHVLHSKLAALVEGICAAARHAGCRSSDAYVRSGLLQRREPVVTKHAVGSRGQWWEVVVGSCAVVVHTGL